MKRVQLFVLTLALSFAAGVSSGGFNDRTVKGTWSLAVRGATVEGNGLGVPAGTELVAVATVRFDGRGRCESIDQIVVGGTYIPSRDGFRDTRDGGSCVYAVNPDGTGFFDVIFPDAPVTHTTFVISNRNQMPFIANNPELGIFGAGEMRRQRRGGHDDD